jgi:hypothetical protein
MSLVNYKDKYLKYKNKYFNLRLKYKNKYIINQTGGVKCKTCNNEQCDKTLYCRISNIPSSAISIERIRGNVSKETELIIISGFSNSSYDRNYKSLFEYYDIKLDINQFNKVHLIKFQDDEYISIREFHGELLKEDPLLENELYRKLAEIINEKLDVSNYTILAKSAGGGVGIYLSQLIPKQINKLLLFAPGVGYINNDIKQLKLDEDKIIVGWNREDTKVKIDKIWSILSKLLPNTKVYLYNMDIKEGVDTQHEINSEFIKKIY